MRHNGRSLHAELSEAIIRWRVVGVPNRDRTEARPIAIASVFLRAWHKSIADALPQLPKPQWSELRVGRAFSNWLEFRGLAGAEVDQEKAFDLIQHEAAKTALLFRGTPIILDKWIASSWKAPRWCHVHGSFAETLRPTRNPSRRPA